MTQVECVLDAKAALGESPVWVEEEGVLYWADITGRAIHRFDPVSRKDCSWTFSDTVGSFALRKDGGLIAALGADVCLVDLETMALETVAGSVCDKAVTRLNDGKCDRAGRFWVGSMDRGKTRRIGALYCVEAGGGHRKVADGLIISNGLAWSPDDRVMYHADTRQDTIWAYDFDLETGAMDNRREFATVDPRQGRPDGAAVDSDGFYWSAGVGSGCVTRYAPDGRVDRIVRLPVSSPTMCAFGGAGLDVLYVTSARELVPPDDLANQPLAGGLFAVDAGVKGLPEPRFV